MLITSRKPQLGSESIYKRKSIIVSESHLKSKPEGQIESRYERNPVFISESACRRKPEQEKWIRVVKKTITFK
jgi:hypothetical protein